MFLPFDTSIKLYIFLHNVILTNNIFDILDIYLNSDTYYTYDDLCEEILEIFDSEFYDDGDEIE